MPPSPQRPSSNLSTMKLGHLKRGPLKRLPETKKMKMEFILMDPLLEIRFKVACTDQSHPFLTCHQSITGRCFYPLSAVTHFFPSFWWRGGQMRQDWYKKNLFLLNILGRAIGPVRESWSVFWINWTTGVLVGTDTVPFWASILFSQFPLMRRQERTICTGPRWTLPHVWNFMPFSQLPKLVWSTPLQWFHFNRGFPMKFGA